MSLERLWPHRAGQPTFRAERWTDLAWFTSSALLVQFTAFLVLALGNTAPAAMPAVLRAAVTDLLLRVQLPAIIVVADTAQTGSTAPAIALPTAAMRYVRPAHQVGHAPQLAAAPAFS